MTVEELITKLKTFPSDMSVAYEIYSEYAVLEPNDLYVKGLQPPRPDGWIHEARPDKPKQNYLVFLVTESVIIP